MNNSLGAAIDALRGLKEDQRTREELNAVYVASLQAAICELIAKHGPGEESPGPLSLADEDALVVLEEAVEMSDIFEDGCDEYRERESKKRYAALAHLRSRLASRRVSREWVARLVEICQGYGNDGGWPAANEWPYLLGYLRELGIEVGGE